jgi:hypothetical protein
LGNFPEALILARVDTISSRLRALAVKSCFHQIEGNTDHAEKCGITQIIFSNGKDIQVVDWIHKLPGNEPRRGEILIAK